jgi:hypothetical protein
LPPLDEALRVPGSGVLDWPRVRSFTGQHSA